MTVFFHELKRSKKTFWIWTLVISFMLAVCVFMYPEMESQMEDVSKMFSDMGSFSSAFGMDSIDFGTLEGYFAVECGNVLGIGGALFAAILGIGALAKEEKEHTAEFLLSHPISRERIVFEKLLSVVFSVTAFNVICFVLSLASFAAIGELKGVKTLVLLFLAYYPLSMVIACITFGISSFLKGSGMGIGIGLAFLMYFLNILSNITDKVKFLKYFTPYGFTEGSEILSNQRIEIKYLFVWICLSVAGIIIAFAEYKKKDIAA